MAEVETARRRNEGPRFVTGSLLGHILSMTAAGAVGLMAIFIGDLANIYFLSRLGDEAIVAALGYASSVLFFSTSIGIGLSIAATSLVAPALGARRRVRARRLSANAHVLSFLFSAIASVAIWLAIGPLLELLGASGRTFELARFYLLVLVPTLPLLSLGMTSAAVLRSVGDARRAMFVTLSGAIVNTVLDLIFIVHFGMGLEGAVLSSLLARIAIMCVGLYGVVAVHDLMGRPKLATLKSDMPPYCRIAGPAVLTNIAPAVGNGYITLAMSRYGDAAVAAWAIIGRITPVAFGAIYALSGTVGPILGQNFGARSPSRMRDVFTLSLLTMAAFTGLAWLILAAVAHPLADLFRAGPETRKLIVFFCRWLSPLFVFLGTVFITSAVFNTLGRAHYSTLLNWGRATLGTVPFVVIGGHLDGAEGALAGNMIGGVAFGLIAIMAGYRLIARVGKMLAL
ncbi:MATE family efflux transporter [Hyphomicrobium sp.]|uniref:MATE family efflux transporter n=1 Tax=Hyphomicrobium sp. TaxID=82 RepID=UPI000FBBF420|nr:MATE family efflux transporter [Hyphomicrobium sp.]RUP09397.1 MAG: MATE family efflux transporter [Hyphomicrobium sp.]